MKLSSIFSMAALALASTVNADFVIKEGIFTFSSDTTEAMTSAEQLFLDAKLIEAMNENAADDYVAESMEVTSIDIIPSRRNLGEQSERKLPNWSNWSVGSSTGGHCNFCYPHRALKEEDRKLSELMAASACNKLQTGPYPKFHGISDCEIAMVVV